MASNLGIAKIEHATAMVKYRTVQLELRARKIQLLIACVGFATTALGALAALIVAGGS